MLGPPWHPSSSSVLFLTWQPIIAPRRVDRVIGLRVCREALASRVGARVVLTTAEITAILAVDIVRLATTDAFEAHRSLRCIIIDKDDLRWLVSLHVAGSGEVCGRQGKLMCRGPVRMLVIEIVALHLVKLVSNFEDVTAANGMLASVHLRVNIQLRWVVCKSVKCWPEGVIIAIG